MDGAGADVLETLRQASSQDTTHLKWAEQRLKSWETQPGFYATLLQIFCNYSIDVNIRWLAILYIKNGVDRYWRKTAPNAISEEEKSFMRSQLIASFQEPFPQIATQIAVLVSKIARIESRDWPELLPALFEGTKSSNALVQQRSLLILNQVTKTLASKRLAPDRQLFRELTANIFGYILEIWQTHTAMFLEQFHAQNPKSQESLELSILTLKVLRQLVVHGCKDFGSDSQQMGLLRLTLERITVLLQCRNNAQNNSAMTEKLEKAIVLFTKVLLDVQDHHALAFVPLIRPSLEFAVNQIFAFKSSGMAFEKFVVHCCNLVKGIVKSVSYRPPKQVKETTDPLTLQAYQAKMDFFTPAVLSEVIQCLVMCYFPLTEQDLEEWEANPEEYANEEVGESWRYQLKPSVEVLYLSLFSEFRASVTPVVVNMIKTVQISTETQDLSVLLKKDAVYNAAGLASYDLFDEVDFDQWFTSRLVAEMQNKAPRYKLLRCRVTELIAHWINVKLSPSVRPVLYESLLQLLTEGEDLVVRLTAAKTLKAAIDDVEFTIDDFLPYLEAGCTLLFNLLRTVSECDTKMNVLHVLSLLIERVKSKIRPHASSLSLYLPQLWQESGDHNMLKCAILATMAQLVEGLGPSSVNLYPFLLPVIQLSTDTSQPPHVYLLEDGMDLWHKVLDNAPQLTPELLHLFRNMPALLELGTENIRTCFGIIESYVLLQGAEFLKNFGANVVNACQDMLGNIKPEGAIIVARVVETVVKAFPADGVQLLQPVLRKVFQMTLDGEDYSPLLVIYLSIFAEMILHDSRTFCNFVESVATGIGKQTGEAFAKFLDVWLEKMDCMIKLERRKCAVLGMCSLLPLNISCVLDRFALILDVAVSVFHEAHQSDDGVHTDALVLFAADEVYEADGDNDTEGYKRKRQLCLSGPVHRVPLWRFVREKLEASQQVYGDVHFNHLMETMDSVIASQLLSFINH